MEGHKGQITLDAEMILDRLLTGEPLALVRYGDGEAMVLNALNDPAVYTRVLKRQFGRIPTWEDALKIRENLIFSLQNADIIGYKLNVREGRFDYWSRSKQILDEYVEPKQYCCIDIGYDFIEKGYFDRLFARFDRVLYISCRDVRAQLQAKGVRSDGFHIAPEMMFTSYDGPAHYPDQFVKIESWMDKRDCRTLCLVGAGVAGKIYVNWFRDRGGVAFDIGSVFDTWAGYVTRGPERAKDKKTNENIL